MKWERESTKNVISLFFFFFHANSKIFTTHYHIKKILANERFLLSVFVQTLIPVYDYMCVCVYDDV